MHTHLCTRGEWKSQEKEVVVADWFMPVEFQILNFKSDYAVNFKKNMVRGSDGSRFHNSNNKEKRNGTQK